MSARQERNIPHSTQAPKTEGTITRRSLLGRFGKPFRASEGNKSGQARDPLTMPGGASQIGRRDFLIGAGAMTTLAILPGGGIFPTQVPESEGINEPSSEDNPTEAESQEHEKSTSLNNNTARAVVGGFTGIIIGVTADKLELGKGTVATMTGLETSRLIALRTSKKDSDQEAYKHDMAELIGAYPLIPVLVEAAHVATNVRVNIDKIFEDQDAASIGLPEEDIMPSMLAETSEWEEYLEKQSSQVANLIGKMNALGSMAPEFTTYWSSSTTNQLHERAFQSIYKMKYVHKVVETRKAVDKGNIAEESMPSEMDLKLEALIETQKLVDSPGGLLDLATALFCNNNGDAFFGDPPNFYALFKKPQYFPEYTALGLTINEINSFALSSMFLKIAGVKGNTKRFAKSFLEGQRDLLKVQYRSLIKDKQLRDISFGGKNGAFAIFELMQKGDYEGVEERLGDIPEGYFRSDIRSILGHQRKAIGSRLRRLERRINADELTDERFDYDAYEKLLLHNGSFFEERDPENPDENHENDSFIRTAMIEAWKDKDYKTLTDYIRKMLEARAKSNQSDIAALFEGMRENGISVGVENSTDEEAKSRTNMLRNLFDLAKGNLSDKKPNLNDLYEAFSEDDKAKYWDLASTTDDEDIRQALMIMLSMQNKHDEPEEGHGHDKNKILSESAAEVAFALPTQIPAVPALVHVVKNDLLPLLTKGIDDPDKKLKRERDVILLMSELISSTADNVAAYLFALTSLQELYKERYGDRVLEENKGLDKAISFAAIFAAVYAGGLSKFGNGPNFLQERPVGSIDEDGELRIHSEKRKLKDTMHNPYALGGSAAVYFLGRHGIDKAASDIKVPLVV